jgi:small-conductance mechanosensitive channel
MTDAALVDDNMPPLDPVPEQEPVEAELNTQEESAPQPVETPTEPTGAEKRINKITGEKYAQQRRADALQAELDKLKAAQNVAPEVKAPTLEDFDYDESKFQAASIEYQVNQVVTQKAAAMQQQEIAAKQQAVQQEVANSFNEQVAAKTAINADYQEVVSQLPEFNSDTLGAIMGADNGADIAYALGQRLDLAYEIANASPMAAAMKLGELQAQLKAAPQIKTSAAPAPIESLSSGGAISKDIGEMSMEELYNL